MEYKGNGKNTKTSINEVIKLVKRAVEFSFVKLNFNHNDTTNLST